MLESTDGWLRRRIAALEAQQERRMALIAEIQAVADMRAREIENLKTQLEKVEDK